MPISILWLDPLMNTAKLCIGVLGVHCTCTYTFVESVKQNYVLIPTDPTLTPSNLTSALDSLPDRLWWNFGMRVPSSTLNKIQSQFHTNGERKAALLSVFATEHPEPTWEHVSDVLYRMGEDEECHRTLDIVQSKYPTGESLPPSFLPPLSHHSHPSHTTHTNTPSSFMYTTPPLPLSSIPSPPYLSLSPSHLSILCTYFPCTHTQAGVNQIVPVCTCMFPWKITCEDLACILLSLVLFQFPTISTG